MKTHPNNPVTATFVVAATLMFGVLASTWAGRAEINGHCTNTYNCADVHGQSGCQNAIDEGGCYVTTVDANGKVTDCKKDDCTTEKCKNPGTTNCGKEEWHGGSCNNIGALVQTTRFDHESCP